MIRVRIVLLAAKVLRGVAYGLTWLGDLANPVLARSRWCEERARAWDRRLWERGQHTDLHPPPGA